MENQNLMKLRSKAQFVLVLVAILVVTAILPASAQSGLSGKITVAGSSALLPMMQLAAREFQTTNPGVEIAVAGGGSGAGRKQVCEGQVTIGDSDVRLTTKEKNTLNCGNAVETPVAIQAFAPVANPAGPGSVTSLTRKQLQDIFSGKITNWKDVGGDNQAIVLINRIKGSGTRAVMARYLWDGVDKFAVGASEEDNSQTVLDTVKQTPGAISYLGFAYLNDSDVVAIKINDIAATRDDIMNGRWPIVGIGFSITKGQPDPVTNAFLSYVISQKFQNSPEFEALGYVPVYAPSQIKTPAPGSILKGAVDVTAIASNPKFNRWQVDVLANESDQKVINVGNGSTEFKSPGKLLTMDTTKLPNGLHTLRLRVVRNDQNYDEYKTTINVQN